MTETINSRRSESDPRRIALVWNADVPLLQISTRYEPYVHGLQSLGWDPITVCREGLDHGFPHPVRTFADWRQPSDPSFWRELGCQASFIITWHRMTDELRAMRSAGMRVVALTDSDGLVSLRYHPWPTFRFRVALQSTIRGKAAAAKYWLTQRLLNAGLQERELVENVEASAATALPGQGCVDEFIGLLGRLGSAHLASRVHWLPYPVFPAFCTTPVRNERLDRVIAIGRWDSPQKNWRLLARTVERSAALRPRTEFLIAGTGSNERFASLAKCYPRVQVVGVRSRDQIREWISESRVLLMSSRWEGSPIVANEMLALGGTVVGTPIPSLRGIAACGRFGVIAKRHTSGALAEALRTELERWDANHPNPASIAAYWRSKVSPAAVATRIISLLNLSTAQEDGLTRPELCRR